MSRRVSRWAGVLAMATVLAACTGAASSSAPPAPSASPGGPAVPAYRLRATTTQAIRPSTGSASSRWSRSPAITASSSPARIEIFPGPLLPNLQARPISDGGFAKIVDRGRALGMFSRDGNSVPPDAMPGASWTDRIVVDGVLHDLTGDPSRVIVCVTTPCDPTPGTPEAFGAFWASLSDLTWLGADLGREAPYVADSYAILVGVDPADRPAIRPAVAIWPLQQQAYRDAWKADRVRAYATTGWTVREPDVIALRPSLEGA